MKIRELEPRDRVAFENYVQRLKLDESPFSDLWMVNVAKTKAFADFLLELQRLSVLTAEDEHSPNNLYFAFDDDGEIVGFVHCRWDITKRDLLQTGGHIAYYVLPECRGNRLAEKMVQEILPFYQARGIREVWIMANEKNAASRHIIEKLGGQLQNIVEDGKEKECRYLIKR